MSGFVDRAGWLDFFCIKNYLSVGMDWIFGLVYEKYLRVDKIILSI
jgi:hypothetical protein